MSPLTVRRYRAERMLRREFEGLRGKVMGTVQGRLRASGVSLDRTDLDACYAQAWQGLYAAMLAGEEISNPTGWLALVTFRRAIEEHRSRRRSYPTGSSGERRRLQAVRAGGESEPAEEHDFASELDDRIRLRQVFEALRGRLSERELQAAALCYLQGLSRAEAATRMGISEARMRKLMEGAGPGRTGVAGKVGALVETIRVGNWCEEQGSLMRAFAFGILDPAGERYQLALAHRSECPACRAYVLSLRGLAAVLPVPMFLPGALGAGALTGAGVGAGASVGGGAAGGAGSAVGAGAAAPAGSGIGALSASGAGAGAGAGAVGGGWLLAGGPVGAKLAVGCLVALGVGASCVALNVAPDRGLGGREAIHRRHDAGVSGAGESRTAKAIGAPMPGYVRGVAVSGNANLHNALSGRHAAASLAKSAAALTPAAKASREFGPEQRLNVGPSRPLSASAARVAPSGSSERVSATEAGGAPLFSGAPHTSTRHSSSAASASSASNSRAQREFAPG